MSKNGAIKESVSYRIYKAFAYTLVIVWCLICILPLVHIFSISVSDKAAADAGIVGLIPKSFSLENYGKALTDSQIIRSLLISLERTVLAVMIEITMTILAAYPLSKTNEEFPGRSVISLFFLICMIFGGGLVPTYIQVAKELKLNNTIWALVLPGAVSIGHIVLLMNFFRSIPKDIEEAAKIDGAGHGKILLKIILPLSVNAVLTLVLFISVGQWNAWFDGLIYTTDAARYPLSTYLYNVRNRLETVSTQEDARLVQKYSQQGMIMTYTMICLTPIAVIYPVLQRYVKQGLIIGSVKG
mgnify:FL=1